MVLKADRFTLLESVRYKIAVGDMVLIENEDLVLKHEPSFGLSGAFNTAQGILQCPGQKAFVKSVNRDEINNKSLQCLLTTPVAPASPFYVEGLRATTNMILLVHKNCWQRLVGPRA